jgi:hypothetical protein
MRNRSPVRERGANRPGAVICVNYADVPFRGARMVAGSGLACTAIYRAQRCTACLRRARDPEVKRPCGGSVAAQDGVPKRSASAVRVARGPPSPPQVPLATAPTRCSGKVCCMREGRPDGAMAGIYCGRCGRPNPRCRYCSNCGAPLMRANTGASTAVPAALGRPSRRHHVDHLAGPAGEPSTTTSRRPITRRSTHSRRARRCSWSCAGRTRGRGSCSTATSPRRAAPGQRHLPRRRDGLPAARRVLPARRPLHRP